jgi:hypothetical protein
MQSLQQAFALLLRDSVANHPNHQTSVTTLMALTPASIRSTQYNLPQKNENNHNELFILTVAHLYPLNSDINCY